MVVWAKFRDVAEVLRTWEEDHFIIRYVVTEMPPFNFESIFVVIDHFGVFDDKWCYQKKKKHGKVYTQTKHPRALLAVHPPIPPPTKTKKHGKVIHEHTPWRILCDSRATTHPPVPFSSPLPHHCQISTTTLFNTTAIIIITHHHHYHHHSQ
jgi:hypothetical protein